MSKIAQKLKDALPQAGQQADEVRAAISELNARIDVLKKERDALSKRTVTRDDVVGVICADIDRLADEYRGRMARQFETIGRGANRRRLVLSVAAVDQHKLSTLKSVFGGLLGFEPHTGPYSDLSQQAALFLFRPELKRAAAEVVDAADLDYTDAAPYAESTARIAVLDGEISALQAEKYELIELAKRHSLNIEEAFAEVARVVGADTFDAEAHPWTYHRKRPADSTPTGSRNIIRTHKIGGADEYIDEADMPPHLRALIGK